MRQDYKESLIFRLNTIRSQANLRIENLRTSNVNNGETKDKAELETIVEQPVFGAWTRFWSWIAK